MKLWEGNVFNHVCQSVYLFKGVGRRVSMWPLPMMHWTSLYRASLVLALAPRTRIRYGTPWPCPLGHQTWDFFPAMPSSQYWHLVPITGDLFKIVHMRTPPPTSTDICWPPKHVRLAARMLSCKFCCIHLPLYVRKNTDLLLFSLRKTAKRHKKNIFKNEAFWLVERTVGVVACVHSIVLPVGRATQISVSYVRISAISSISIFNTSIR